MGRNQDYTDGGIASFFEDRANGLNTATMHAPAALAGSYDVELMDALPAGTEVLRIDAAGKLSTTLGSGGSLDTAYDFGGPGAGRVILTTDGPLELAGVDGLRLNTTIPKIEFETDVTDFNYRISASATANKLLFQRGDQDADISDDVFVTILSVDELRMVGVNTANPQEALHVTTVAGDAKVRIQAPALSDASIPFFEDSVSRFELGYDDSAGGFVLGRTDFTNPVMFVEDVTGDVGINEVAPDAKFHVTSTAALASLIESSNALARLGLRASGTTDENQVGVMADGDDLILFGGAAARVVVQADGRVGIGIDPPIAKLHVDESVSGDGIRITHTANAQGLNIIKAAGNGPCLRLQQLATGQRAPYNMTAMTTGPTASADGDFWHVSSLNRLKFSFTGIERSIIARDFRPAGPQATATISSGVLVPAAPVTLCAAETGTTDTVDTISVGAAEDGDKIIVRADVGDDITFAHGTGNLILGGSANKLLNNRDQMELILEGGEWLQLTVVINLPA